MTLYRVLTFLFFVCLLFNRQCYPLVKHDLAFPNKFHLIVTIPETFQYNEESIVESIKNSFIKLHHNQVGRVLLNRIGVLFLKRFPEKHRTEVHIDYSEEGRHSFVLPKNQEGPLIIKLNYNNLSGARVGTIGKLSRMENGRECYQIGSMYEPFHIILGHELIHLLHYLELGREHYKERLRSPGINIHAYKERLRSPRISDLYSLRTLDVWKNLEERNTVIGDAPYNHHQITENNLLREERLLPRYAYQSAGDNFYENRTVIERFYPGQSLKYLVAKQWEFDPQRAKESRKSVESGCVVDAQPEAFSLNMGSPQKKNKLPLRLKRRFYRD